MKKQDKEFAIETKATLENAPVWTAPRLIRLNPDATSGGSFSGNTEGTTAHVATSAVAGSI